MPRYRVHLAVRRPDNKGGSTVTVDVEADLDFTAMEMARQRYYQTHPLNRDYLVHAVKVEKKG
ncbi:MAG: hypothetical protein JSR26_00145 [Proteobacteria bacterium]|nr:hypothetical protein [Pseudomonadota bacterium]